MLFCAFVIGETAARVVQRARGLFSVCAFLLGGFGDGGAAAVGGLELLLEDQGLQDIVDGGEREFIGVV